MFSSINIATDTTPHPQSNEHLLKLTHFNPVSHFYTR